MTNKNMYMSNMDKEGSVEIGGESITPYPYTYNTRNFPTYNVGIDYLNLNFPMKYPEEQMKLLKFIKLLKLDDQEFEHIISKSKSSKTLLRETYKYTNSTAIFINDSVSKDSPLTRIELKGNGCRELEDRFQEDYLKGYYDLLYNVIFSGGWCSRFDIFVDIVNGNITTKELDKKIQACEYVSNFRKVRNDSTKFTKDYSNDGWGYLFGSEGSGTRLRIYDKKAEQIARGKEIDLNIKSWIRFEIRFYHDVAKTMSQELLGHLYDMQNYAYQLLKGVIEFKVPSEDSNKSRWDTWKKWDNFLGGIEKIKPFNQFKHESSIDVTKKWYSRSATKALQQARLTMDPDEFEKEKLKNDYVGLSKLTQADINMINIERNKKNLPLLCMRDIEDRIKEVVEKAKKYDLYLESKEAIEWGTDIFGDILKII